MSSHYFHFRGGRVIDQGEELSNQFPVRMAPLLPVYRVPLAQNIGKMPQVCVEKGTVVCKGDLIAKADGFVSANLHAPTSGTIKGIVDIPGVMGTIIPAIEIESDSEDKWGACYTPMPDFLECDPKAMLTRVQEAGIVGMGGASFPTHVKLAPPPDKKVDCLIINGAECEPYLTTDERLMIEHAEEAVKGIAICSRILGVRKVIVGVEANKKNAIVKLRECAAMYGIDVVKLPVRYPQGAEKQLIYALTKRKVPAGGLPMDAGCVVQNIGTCRAIADAVINGHPLIERSVTVTGTPLVNPGNWQMKIGTSYAQAITWAGGVKGPTAKVISGGPMMGFAQRSLDVSVCKNTSGILLLAPDEIAQFHSDACIRCGRCVDACPMNLLCSTISVASECGEFDHCERLHVMDCIECGCCSFGCPSYRPLVQHIKRAKAEIIAQRRKAQAQK